MTNEIFLRFEIDGFDQYEWGFYVPSGYVPAVGDIVSLWFAEPDTESGWDVDSQEPIDGKVIKRNFCFADDFEKRLEIWYVVKLENNPPHGLIAHSTEWPAYEKRKRDAELKQKLDSIRNYIFSNKDKDNG